MYKNTFSFCALLENTAEQLCYWKQLKTIYGLSIPRACVEMETYCSGEIHARQKNFTHFEPS